MSKSKIMNTRGRTLSEKEMLRLEIGMRIRRERTLWNMTQEELSALLGISTNYLGQIERGNRDLSRKIEDRLCELFNLSRADFTTEIGNVDWTFDISDGGILHDISEYDLMRLLKSCSPEELQFCGHILRSTLHYLRSIRQSDRVTEAEPDAAADQGADASYSTAAEQDSAFSADP